MERLARIRERILSPKPSLADQLTIMTNDPDMMQRGLQQIEAEFD